MEWVTKIIEFLKSAQIVAWVYFLDVAFEFWLSRTDIVQAGSKVELVLNAAKKVVSFIKGILPKDSEPKA